MKKSKSSRKLERVSSELFQELPSELAIFVRGSVLIGDPGGTFGTMRPVYTAPNFTIDPQGDEPDAS